MIFWNQHSLESNKERNLYAKFFAGFYFNELVDRYETRLGAFADILRNPTYHVGNLLPSEAAFSPKATHVSFDVHADKILGSQQGEYADILVHDRDSGLIVGIEVKYLDDWDFSKDVIDNGEKLRRVGKRFGYKTVLPCLLVTKRKWDNVKARRSQRNSNYARLLKHDGDLTVILWEQFLDHVHEPRVTAYLQSQLDKKL